MNIAFPVFTDNHKMKEFVKQFFRYLVVGGIAFLMDIGLLYILTTYCNLHYLLAAAFSFLLGLSVNYTLSIYWVFNKRTFSNVCVEWAVFFLIGFTGLILNELFIWLFTSVLHVYYVISKCYSTVIVFLWNFLARKFLLFR